MFVDPEKGLLERILAHFEESSSAEHMNIPGFRLHPLKGDFVGLWVVAVSRNWRMVFRFEIGQASQVDLVD